MSPWIPNFSIACDSCEDSLVLMDSYLPSYHFIDMDFLLQSFWLVQVTKELTILAYRCIYCKWS